MYYSSLNKLTLISLQITNAKFMKKKCFYYVSLFSLFLFSACSSSEDGSPSGEGNGKVQFYLSQDATFPKEKLSGETTAQPYEDIKNYTVELVDGSGATVLKERYGDIELASSFKAGQYSVKAYYGENLPAAYNSLYVAGGTNFTIVKDETANVSFVCKPANAKVKVVYEDGFFDYFSDCTLEFTTPYTTSPFQMTKADSDKALFLKAGENEDLKIAFILKNKKGELVTIPGFGVQTLKLSARDFLTITIKPQVPDIEQGTIKGITVSIDTELGEEDVNIDIPNEMLPGEDTEVTN